MSSSTLETAPASTSLIPSVDSSTDKAQVAMNGRNDHTKTTADEHCDDPSHETTSSPNDMQSLTERTSLAVSEGGRSTSIHGTQHPPTQSRSLDNPPRTSLSSSVNNSAHQHSTQQSTGSATMRSNDTERGRRRRSALDFRSGPRLSDLFSSFLNRRHDAGVSNDHLPRNVSPNANENNNNETVAGTITSVNNIITPILNVPRPETPPPALPPPTLAELGLSMSVLTANLTPAHFSTPPTSGTFLAPHYLLLCHVQGLDVLPLVSPPTPEPYALVRRICFKSVVVMEERGVLIAIAGRRDGVRVYALDELRRVIEWRLELEARKERERSRKEDAKKLSGNIDHVFSLAAAPPKSTKDQREHNRRSLRASTMPNGISLPPPQPRSPTVPFDRRGSRTPKLPNGSVPVDSPPAYTANHSPSFQNRRLSSSRPLSMLSTSGGRVRSGSVSTIVGTGSQQVLRNEERGRARDRDTEEKGDWIEAAGSSDDEALSLAAAGASGSAALDERTSAMPPPASASGSGMNVTINNSTRPPNLRELRGQSVAIISQVGDTHSPTAAGSNIHHGTLHSSSGGTEGEGEGGNDEEDEPTTPTGEISLAQALLESRIPDLPPPGTRTQQQPILLPTVSNSIVVDSPSSARAGQRLDDTPPPSAPASPSANRSGRRRWSILGSSLSDPPRERREENRPAELLLNAPSSRGPPPSPTPRSVLRRSTSHRGMDNRVFSASSRPQLSHTHSASTPEPIPPQSAPAHINRRFNGSTPSLPSTVPHRFIPRILSAALGSRKSEENIRKGHRYFEKEHGKNFASPIGAPPPPQPKLDYVKLPGTKGSVLIKAVETARKSFLAILCGEAGEKVELFAGTYRTALSLSRTFILPDSPRSLELQVQGDDLVEIYLVFSQNVFGLEPATVRVREVRIGRAERRAARRRAREGRSSGGDETPAVPDDETSVSVNIGVVGSEQTGMEDSTGRDGIDEPDPEPQTSLPTSTSSDPNELIAVAAAQTAPYTTFQQLSFAPAFPLATLGYDVIIPPSYPAFLRHHEQHESNANDNANEIPVQQQFTPPGLPPPRMVLQCKWYYRDPKGVVQGPWKTSLMQSWYKDGLLPMDLPVRRDIDTEYMSLKDLRAQSTDPDQPFKQHVPATLDHSPQPPPVVMEARPLLPPVSIIEQPRHFGPPALFFSSRGGHSTTIVDAKGRPVLRGRLMWSVDEDNDTEQPSFFGKLGDVKRVEAFDVQNRAVIVALRQGGLEAVDVGDALHRPADESRGYIPLYQAPTTGFNRRGSYVWRIGGPLAVPQSASPVASWNPRSTLLKKGTLRSPGRTEFNLTGDEVEYSGQEEVLFLGRREDDLYLCERNSMSFRILRLSPS